MVEAVGAPTERLPVVAAVATATAPVVVEAAGFLDEASAGAPATGLAAVLADSELAVARESDVDAAVALLLLVVVAAPLDTRLAGLDVGAVAGTVAAGAVVATGATEAG